jgi:hypothetical protein
MRQAAGLTFAMLSPVCLAMALAISGADPAYSNSEPLIAPYVFGAVIFGLIFATASYLLFRPRRRSRRSTAPLNGAT